MFILLIFLSVIDLFLSSEENKVNNTSNYYNYNASKNQVIISIIRIQPGKMVVRTIIMKMKSPKLYI